MAFILKHILNCSGPDGWALCLLEKSLGTESFGPPAPLRSIIRGHPRLPECHTREALAWHTTSAARNLRHHAECSRGAGIAGQVALRSARPAGRPAFRRACIHVLPFHWPHSCMHIAGQMRALGTQCNEAQSTVRSSTLGSCSSQRTCALLDTFHTFQHLLMLLKL